MKDAPAFMHSLEALH